MSRSISLPFLKTQLKLRDFTVKLEKKKVKHAISRFVYRSPALEMYENTLLQVVANKWFQIH